ncbi:hypothetical protein [Robiginitomaculum antarcticum]|uniref:hypothetical protein n=1 Tax=Robiginitomaculum antarcticum TaxID=437507 RepID=UPI000380A94C|nr:hypothetical protein [Robiginitomaculum antarcticum]
MTDDNLNIMAVDTALGGDAAAPGIAQPVSLTEIQDMIYSDRPLASRREELLNIKHDLTARHSADTEAGFGPLLDEVERGLSLLDKNPEGVAAPAVLDPIDEAASRKNV